MTEIEITLGMKRVPLEDHPMFSKPDVRFRHAKVRRQFKRMKEMGITTFLSPYVDKHEVKTP